MPANDQPPANQPSKLPPAKNGATHTTPEIVERAASPSGRTSRQVHTEPDFVFDEIVESASVASAS